MINRATALTRSYMKMIIGKLINVVGKVLKIKIVMPTMMIRILIIAINFIYNAQAHSSVEKAGLIGLVKLR